MTCAQNISATPAAYIKKSKPLDKGHESPSATDSSWLSPGSNAIKLDNLNGFTRRPYSTIIQKHLANFYLLKHHCKTAVITPTTTLHQTHLYLLKSYINPQTSHLQLTPKSQTLDPASATTITPFPPIIEPNNPNSLHLNQATPRNQKQSAQALAAIILPLISPLKYMQQFQGSSVYEWWYFQFWRTYASHHKNKQTNKNGEPRKGKAPRAIIIPQIQP